MASHFEYAALRRAEEKLLPCRKCMKKPHFEEDYSGYGATNDFKICCETEDKCKTAIQTLNDRMEMPDQKYGSLLKLMACWDEQNRMELEWFPDRLIPSSSDLEKWDSQNSLRPLKTPESSTSRR